MSYLVDVARGQQLRPYCRGNTGASIRPKFGARFVDIDASADRSQTHGSRITNGMELLANVDGRTAAALGVVALRVVALLTSRAKGVYQV